MKKIILAALSVFMLCACSGGKKGSQSVCKGTIDGQDMEIILDFDGDDQLTKMQMNMSVDAGTPEVAQVAMSVFEEQQDQLLDEFGGKGNIAFSLDGAVINMVLTLDLAELTEEEKADILDENTTKTAIISQLVDEGCTCK